MIPPKESSPAIDPLRRDAILAWQACCSGVGAKCQPTHGPTPGRRSMHGRARTNPIAFARMNLWAASFLPNKEGRKIAQRVKGVEEPCITES